MNWRCRLGHHDWVRVLHDRVCLRCERHEVPISTGGGWGGWDEIGAVQAERKARQERETLACRIHGKSASHAADAP
jgi:hypothetical protein